MDIVVEYKGINITYSEYDNTWKCEIDETARNKVKDSLKEAKERIDNFLAKEKKFEPYEVLSAEQSSWNSLIFGEKVKVTSIAQDGDVWINHNGKRSKVNKGKFCKLIPENEAIINQIKKIRNSIAILNEEEKSLFKQLIRLD